MNSNSKVLAGIVVGLLTGVAGTAAVQGQQPETPPAYVISEADAITDVTAIRTYGAKVGDTLAPFKGHFHFLVGGGNVEPLDGDAPVGIVVIAFDSLDEAHAWYNSPAYAAIRPIRQRASKGRMFLVQGPQ